VHKRGAACAQPVEDDRYVAIEVVWSEGSQIVKALAREMRGFRAEQDASSAGAEYRTISKAGPNRWLRFAQAACPGIAGVEAAVAAA
jgi:hypothetical protein